MSRTIAALAAEKFEQRAVESTTRKISTFLKCSPRKSGDRGVTQCTMKAKDVDLPDGSQRELAAGVLKQAAQDLHRFHSATMNRTNIKSFGLNRSPLASARLAVAAYQKRWFQRRRRRHDPWLVLNMSTFNFEPGRSEIFNPIRSHQNVWC
jgi:hypothetical protein